MAGLGYSLPSKERGDFDNTVLELPGVPVVYVKFIWQSVVYAVSDNYRPWRKRDVSPEMIAAPEPLIERPRLPYWDRSDHGCLSPTNAGAR
jgi:hypothetical protein